jgi:FKBP-type peptidyl-prolyl cis-trans isomerase FklB
MKKLFVFGFAALVLVSCGKKAGKEDYKLETFEQKLSYSVGYDVTRSLKKMDVKLDKDLMYKGIIDALADSSSKPMMTNEEMELVFQELQKRNMQNMQQQQSDQAAPNRAKGQEYAAKQMAENPDMKKTPSGLIYKVVKQGTGKIPAISNVVRVKYTGKLIDGTVFDQTGEESTTFEVGGVIPGWTEALQMMPEGSVYSLIIPAELAYGNNPPQGTPIQPGSTLVFEVELLKIEK